MKNTKEWVKSLPLANPTVAIRQLLTRIEEWNQQKISPKERYADLECIGQAATEILSTLRRNLMEVSFPLKSRQQVFADLSDLLRSLIFEGYELVFSEAVAPEQGLIRKHFIGLWILSAHRLFYYARPLLVERQRLNVSSNDDLWMRVHGIYRLVMSNGLQNTKISMPCAEIGKKSIQELYKESLFLSMLPMQELHRTQIFEIENTLAGWSGLLTLHDDGEADYAEADFVIDFYRDHGPIGFSGKEEDNRSEKLLLLDTGKLISLIERIGRYKVKEKKKSRENRRQQAIKDERYDVSVRTLKLLAQTCKPNRGRLEERTQILEQADAFYTFSGIHYHLDSESNSAGIFEHVEYSEISTRINPAIFSGGEENPWDSFCLETDILDISENGMKIEFDGGQELSVRVGDMVGIRRKGEELPLLGQIRWLEVIKGSRLVAGLFLWCKNPSKATLAMKGNDGHRLSLPAFLVEHIKTGKLLLVFSYLPGIHKRSLNLMKANGRLPIQLHSRPLEHSQSFVAYEFGIPSGWKNGRHQKASNLSMRALSLLFKKSSARVS